MMMKTIRTRMAIGAFLVSLSSSPLALADSAAKAATPQSMPTPQQAKSASDRHATNTQKNVQSKVSKVAKDKRTKIVAEAVDAIKQTVVAMQALNNGKKDEAIKALGVAGAKLDVILARDPALALAPVDVKITTFDYYADLDAIAADKKMALHALKENRVQEARLLLRDMASEIVVRTTELPLATYPIAIKDALRLIGEDKNKEALGVLGAALNTLVIEDEVIPLPPLRASLLIEQADILAQKKERTQKEEALLKRLLDDTQWQLRLAEALGYGDSKLFKPMYEELNRIREKTAHNKSGTGFFGKLREEIKNLSGRHTVQHHTKHHK